MFTRLIPCACAAMLLFAAGAWAEDTQLPPPPAPPTPPVLADKNIVDTLKADGHYNTLVAALKTASMTDEFSGKGEFTFFAPNDDAFKKMLEFAEVERDPLRLAVFLRAHVISGHPYTSKEFSTAKNVKAMGGEALTFAMEEGRWTINGAAILKADIPASNGTIHGIDTVLANDKPSKSGELDKAPGGIVTEKKVPAK